MEKSIIKESGKRVMTYLTTGFGFLSIIPFLIASLTGCYADKFNTSHPDEGGIVLTMDWSNIESAVPSTYQAYITSSSGQNKFFENLSGVSNNLVVDPGEAVLYVYNSAENISVNGNKANIINNGRGITSTPGLFYTFSKQIVTERDKDITQTALMNRQTGELKISIAIKPAAMIAKIRTVSAVLENVASELDMLTNELSAPYEVPINFSINTYFAVANLRLFGFVQRSAQNLRLDVEFENGNKRSVTSNLTSFITDFNESKNRLFSLNASMFVPDENASTITIDQWECNTESRYLSVYPYAVELPYSASSQSVTVVTDQSSWVTSISQTGNWLFTSISDNQLTLSVTANTNSESRQATVNISAGGLNENITVTQAASEKSVENYVDKEIVRLQRATIGKGINIVLLGDGYTSNEMGKGTGKYEQDMRAAVDHFFSVYPISAFRNYFNVFMITAISNQSGLSNKSTNRIVDSKFKTLWEGGNSTLIDCDDVIVQDYVRSIIELFSTGIHDITVIMPINANVYAGTCYMYLDISSSNRYGNGFSISMCPVGASFKDVSVHEAAGHGFGKVADEYINNRFEEIPETEKDYIKSLKRYGWYENVDLSNNILETSWSGFANLPKYNMVGVFEGARYYGKGIWRPEYNSCMNNNTPYFNAPTRWAQVRRIYRLAGIDYTFSEFLQDDIIPAIPATRSKGEEFIPLAPPVIKTLRQK